MPERSDISLRGIAVGLLIIVTGIGASLLLAWLLAPRTDARAPDERPALLETAPHQDLQRFVREKEARLHGSGPLEGEPGRVHIPIERAMQLLAEGRHK